MLAWVLEFARTKLTYTFNSSSGYLASKQDSTPSLTWPAAEVKRRPSSPEERPRCAPASTSRRITWVFIISSLFRWTTICNVHLKMTVLHSRHQRRVVRRVPYMHTCTLKQCLQILIWGLFVKTVKTSNSYFQPFSRSHWTIAIWPLAEATWRGVRPLWSPEIFLNLLSVNIDWCIFYWFLWYDLQLL